MYQITISSPEFTHAEFVTDWLNGGELTDAQAADAADAQYAYLVNNVGTKLPGWTYGPQGFTGALRADALTEILNLISDAVDSVVLALDEIKAENPDACVYHRDNALYCDGSKAYRVSGDVWCFSAMRAFTAEMGAGDPAVLAAVKLG